MRGQEYIRDETTEKETRRRDEETKNGRGEMRGDKTRRETAIKTKR